MIVLHFAYSRRHPGRYHVFTRAIYQLGTVRKSTDPDRLSHAWGWEASPYGRYLNGQICDQGHATRLEAGIVMASRVLGVDESEVTFE